MAEFGLFEIHIQLLVYGLMGGVVRVFFTRKATPREIIGYIVVGGFAANFFAPPLLMILTRLPELMMQFVPWPLAFVIGMGGLRICKEDDLLLSVTLKHLERMKE